MQTPTWQREEVQPTAQAWLDYYDGCMMCACDHGCNQWIEEQKYRTSLLMRILLTPNATTSADKVARLPLQRVMNIWVRLENWESQKWNRRLHTNSTILDVNLKEKIAAHDKLIEEIKADKRKVRYGKPKFGRKGPVLSPPPEVE